MQKQNQNVIIRIYLFPP